ncbi:MAG: Asp-tRNA(Asn)/Glu-tRNA(Gln) amidotransferase subunit GatC [Candidatus Marinamargulisbacteria bacterium]
MSSMDINSILELSHLNITDERKAEFSNQIGKILDYMSVLENVKEPASADYEWPLHKDVVERQDEPQSFSHDLVKENAPDFKDGGFSVPRIV